MKLKSTRPRIPKKLRQYKITGGLKNGQVPHVKFPTPIVSPDMFQLHTLAAFIGSRGSGKTHAMVNLALKYLKEGSLNRVFIICPTFGSNRIYDVLKPHPEDVFQDLHTTDTDIQKILDATKQDADHYHQFKIYLEAYKRWSRNKGPLSHEQHVLLENNMYRKPVYIPRPSPLLIVDDMSHTSIYAGSRHNPFINLCLRHRHLNDGLGMTIFMAAQTFKTGIPKPLRQNIQQYFIWPTKDLTQLESIYDEIANLVDPQQFVEMYERATLQKHTFLTIDNNSKHPHLQFRKNFDTLLIHHDSHPPTESKE